MKKSVKVILMMSLFSLSTILMGEERAVDNAQEKEMSVTRPVILEGTNPYQALYLDEEVYRYAKDDLGDLRIVEWQGEKRIGEMPYYIANDESVTQIIQKNYEAHVISTYVKEDRTYVEVQVSQQSKQEDQPLTHLVLQVTNPYFATTVSIEGSYDGLHWETVNGGQSQEIFKVDAQEKLTLYLSEVVKYTYFRLAMPQMTEPLQYERIQACYEETLAEERWYSEQKPCGYEREEVKAEKKTVLTLDNSTRLKVYELVLFLSGPYKRNYLIEGKRADGSTVTLGEGVIYNNQLSKDSKSANHLCFNQARNYKTLLLTIYNLDDQPLEIDNLTVTYSVDKVVFEAEAGHDYSLSYGDATLTKPQYDIVAYENQIEKEAQGHAQLGEVQGIPQAVAEAKEKDYHLIYQALIGVVSVLLIVMIIKSGKKGKVS